MRPSRSAYRSSCGEIDAELEKKLAFEKPALKVEEEKHKRRRKTKPGSRTARRVAEEVTKLKEGVRKEIEDGALCELTALKDQLEAEERDLTFPSRRWS